jgi:hypothetical protein
VIDETERLRLEYDQAGQVLRSLAEIRFKLLALVPTTAGAVVALVSPRSTGVELLAIGLLGLAATLGVLVYELRNAEIGRSVTDRVQALEERLLPGGPLVLEPRTILGGLRLGHSLGVALVYGAAIAGWSYLVAWGVLRAAGLDHARAIGLALGAIAGAAALERIVRLEGAPAPAEAPQPV